MSSDRNLLFGILALQLDFVSHDALIIAMNAWLRAKGRSLGDILIEQGALAYTDRPLLETLVEAHLRQHGGDAQQSLAAVPAPGALRQSRRQIADADVQASVA